MTSQWFSLTSSWQLLLFRYSIKLLEVIFNFQTSFIINRHLICIMLKANMILSESDCRVHILDLNLHVIAKRIGATLIAHNHDDVIKWKYFPRYWPFVREIHRSPVNFPHKGQWRGALMFTLICARMNGWVNNREAGDLRRYLAHYDVIVMRSSTFMPLIPKCMPLPHLNHEILYAAQQWVK